MIMGATTQQNQQLSQLVTASSIQNQAINQQLNWTLANYASTGAGKGGGIPNLYQNMTGIQEIIFHSVIIFCNWLLWVTNLNGYRDVRIPSTMNRVLRQTYITLSICHATTVRLCYESFFWISILFAQKSSKWVCIRLIIPAYIQLNDFLNIRSKSSAISRN